MMKNNKKKMILTSIITLLPILIGLCMWNSLPDSLATHWGADGRADGWSSKAIAVFLPTLSILVLHWVCILITIADSKNKNQSQKVWNMTFWIAPVTSLFANGIIYAASFGMEFQLARFMPCILGVMFALLGNYLPKCKQNRTIGIKVPWTLANEENWNRTHRLCGKIWVAGGLLLIFSVFLPKKIAQVLLSLLFILLILIPIVYSYCLYRRQVKEGTYTINETQKTPTIVSRITMVFTVILLIGVAILLFTGDIRMEYNENSFQIVATYWNDLEVDYAGIKDIEYREYCDAGSRTGGFGSPRLSMGTFQNDEFDYYTRYSYTGCAACVVLNVKDKILVLSGTDAESTKEIYDALMDKVDLPQ